MRLFALILLFALCACAARQEPQPVACGQMYVILPDNFVIDLAAGSTVVLDPAMQEFAVFCGREKALEALGRLAPGLPGNWRVYTLKGEFAEIAKPVGREEFALARPAEVADWVEM